MARRRELLALVIFDCDGVLVDSEPIANRVLAETISGEGAAITTGEAKAAFQGRTMREVAEQVEVRLGRALDEDWIESYERARARAFTAELRAVAGARELLEQLARCDVPTCVASQGRPEKIDLSLALTGLSDLLPAASRFSAYSVPRGKPHPDLFLHAAESLRAVPDSCAVVEDTAIGIQAALAAGMRAIGLAVESDPEVLRQAGAEVIGSLAELEPLLGLEA